MNATLKTNGVETVHELPKRSLLDEIVDENRIAGARYMPVMTPKTAKLRSVALQELKDLCLVENEDYGVIPGTGTKEKPSKPVLLKPGAEKICAYFGYVPHYEIMAGSIEDWSGKLHGEPLFYYHVRCSLMRDGVAVGEGTGSCSSWERKYRYRSSKRTCPSCGSQSLIKGKPDFERDAEYKKRGAWICYEKKGGCGAKYFGDDPEIMDQPLGDVPNPDVADIINTVQKMADKRSYVASVLSATGASQWFTQDLDDQAGHEDAPREQAPTSTAPKSREEAKKAQSDVAQRRIAEEAAKVTEMQKQAPPKSAEDETEERFVQSGKFDRLKMFEQLKKVGFPTAFGLDKGEPLYYDFLASSDVKHCDEFKTLGQARKCFRQMLDHLAVEMARQETERRNKPADSEPFVASDDDLPPVIGANGAPEAEPDQMELANLRESIGAFRKPLGRRFDEILTEHGLKSIFGFRDALQANDVLVAMRAEKAGKG